MNRIINRAIESPILTILLTVLLTCFAAYGMNWFLVDDDFFKIFPEDLESRILWEDITDEFGDSELLFIAFGQKEKDIYNTKIFNAIRNVTDILDTIPIIDKIISLSTIDRIEGNEGWLTIDPLVPMGPIDKLQIQDISDYLDANQDIKDRLVSNNECYTAIAVRSHKFDEKDVYRNNSELLTKVVPVIEEHLSEFDVQYAGNPYITGAVPGLIKNDALTLMISGLLIMIMLLYINIRNIKAVTMILIVIILSIISMNGFMGWMYYLTNGNSIFSFTMISTSMPIVLLTIANSDGVHIITHFFKELRSSKDKKISIQNAMRVLKAPIFLTSITTILAFLAMIFSPIPHMIGFGICISFGIFWAWFLSNTMLPAMVMKSKWSLTSHAVMHEGFLERGIKTIGRIIFTWPRSVLGVGIFFVLLGIIGITFLKVEVNIIKFFKVGSPIRDSTEFIDENFSGTMSLIMRVNSDMKNPETLRNISKIQNYLIEKHPEVKMTLSLSDVIKGMNESLFEDDRIPDSLNQVSSLLRITPKDQLESVVNTDYSSGVIHSYLISLSTEDIIRISNDINSFINNEIGENLNIEISGLMILLKEFVDLVINSSLISIIVSIIAIFIISLIFFKRILWASFAIIPLSSAVILNFGLMGIFDVKLSHLTALLTSIIIGVGVDFAVHYISSYRRNLKENRANLSVSTIDDIGYPILLDVVSNMGFAALLFSDLIPLNYMGGLMIFAMLSTSFGTFLLMGTSIELMKHKFQFK